MHFAEYKKLQYFNWKNMSLICYIIITIMRKILEKDFPKNSLNERKEKRMKTTKTRRFFSAVLAVLMVITMFPVTVFAADEVYTEISSVDELTTGKYVMVTSSGYAPTVLDGSWVLAESVSASGSIANPASNLVWDLTVDGTNVKLTDSNGTSVAPKGGNNNGIKGGDYNWSVSCNDGKFVFAGQGEDTVIFAFNSDAQYLKFRGYKTSTVGNYPDSYPHEFTLYKLEGEIVEPEEPAPEVTEAPVKDGDKVVIYNPANMKALSTSYSGYYNAGVDVTEEGGKLSGYTEAEIWTVGANGDGTFTFSTSEGKKLSMGASYTSMPLDDINTAWKISDAATEGCYYIENPARGAYIEYQPSYGTWSGYYNINDEALFAQKIYVIGGETEPEEPVEPEVPDAEYAEKMTGLPEKGDVIVIYNSGNAMGSAVTGSKGNKLAGVPAEVTAEGLPLSEEMAKLVVDIDDAGNYIFSLDGKYLTSAPTGNGLGFEDELTDCGKWIMEDAVEGAWYIKNAGANYNGNYNQALEYYSGFTTYGIKETEIYQMQLFLVERPEAPEEPEVPSAEKMTELPEKGDVIVIYNSGNAMGSAVTGSKGNKLAGVPAEIADGKLPLSEEMAKLVVDIDDAGNYIFTLDGKYLTSAPTGNGLGFEDELTDCGKWIFEEGPEGTWYIKNAGANYNGNYNQALEYYSGFTTYGIKETEIYQMQLFLVESGKTEGVVTELNDGDTVVIFNPAHMMALSSNYSGYYNAGVVVTENNGKLSGYTEAEIWTVGVNDDGSYTFSTADGRKLSLGASYSSMPLDDINTDWIIEPAKTEDCFYIKNTVRGNYIEWYADKNNWSSYYNNSNEELFAQMFYLVVEGSESEETGLPSEGDEVVLYNLDAEGVLGAESDNKSINNVPAAIDEGVAIPENGGVIFTVSKNGEYFRFYNETYGYLCSNGTGNNAFYTQEASEDADWLILEGKSGGFFLESRTAKYNGTYSQYLEYYSDSYKTYSMYNVTNYDIYEFFFYPVYEGVNVDGGIVNSPEIVLEESIPYFGQDWVVNFTVDSVFGIKGEIVVEVISDPTGDGSESERIENGAVLFGPDGEGNYTVTVSKDIIAQCGKGIVLDITAVDNKDNMFGIQHAFEIIDEPSIGNVSPAAGAQTGADKRPVISAEIINAGEGAAVTMTVKGETVDAVYADGKITYTPSEDMEEGRTTVNVTVVRADGKETSKTWSFIVGKAQYELYFGQLHSHTTYSDGSGSLESALDYIAGLPESANVDFVAFTDHSNYFDGSSAGTTANPEGALYDMSLASTVSQGLWNTYKNTIAEFNASQGEVIAIGGFEMTWSGGPGHMNTFNTAGIVSRNNTTLNNKTADAGMKAYYALLSQSEGADSISQFNHPGSTFGTFSDFAYWDALIDSRIQLVEVGNGEGQVGAGGYYPSYEYYTMALDKGWHVAPTNNQDNHKGKWGNANEARDVILTDNFTEEGLYDAMRAMRMYSTEDKNLEIGYTVNGMLLGSSIEEVPEKLNVEVTVYDPDKSDSISKVEVIVNSGKVAHVWDDPAELATGTLSVELAPEYSYYYIRVTEGDGDLAVTAPVWVGESLKLGISAVETTTATPVTGEELTITTTLFNSEEADATIKSLVYTTEGGKVIGTDLNTYVIPASSSQSVSFAFTPEVAKVTKITVTAVVELEGVEYTFTMDIELDVQDADKLVYIGIDASHYNEYVNGNYKDSMGNFSLLASEYNVRTVTLYSSEDLIAACSNPKYKALILTAPSRRSAEAQASNPLKVYTEEELAAIKAFNANGGIVILAGWSDHYENYPSVDSIVNMKPEEHMAATQNAVLEALGSSLRIGDDATYDDDYNGGQAYRLYFNTYNYDNFLVEGVEVDPENPHDRLYTEVFSHYGGASVYTVDGTLPETVSPVVFGHSGTYSVDVDNDGLGGDSMYKYECAEGDSRLIIMATEQLEGQGLIIVSGAAFMSNFEVQATIEDSGSEKNYSNYKVCENLLAYVNPVSVTSIAEVRAQTEAGYKYTIEGVVTSNASGYDKDTAFFDCIYVQDATGGICCFPVAGNYKIGDLVRITGTTEFYQGEPELQVTSIEILGEGEEVVPEEITAEQLNNRSAEGKLVTVKGIVESFEYANGLIQTIMVKDSEGNVARVFIDGYITTDKDVENIEVGCEITVTGLASYDDTFNAPEGPFPRIRVRDREDIVCTEAEKTDCDHKWGDWEILVNPTRFYSGLKRRTCELCGEHQYRTVSRLVDKEDEVNPGTGAPVSSIGAVSAIAVLAAAAYATGKRK